MTNDRNDWWRVNGGGLMVKGGELMVKGGGLMGNRFVNSNEKLLHLLRRNESSGLSRGLREIFFRCTKIYGLPSAQKTLRK